MSISNLAVEQTGPTSFGPRQHIDMSDLFTVWKAVNVDSSFSRTKSSHYQLANSNSLSFQNGVSPSNEISKRYMLDAKIMPSYGRVIIADEERLDLPVGQCIDLDLAGATTKCRWTTRDASASVTIMMNERCSFVIRYHYVSLIAWRRMLRISLFKCMMLMLKRCKKTK